MRRVAALTVAVMGLAGCGGGGSQAGTRTDPFVKIERDFDRAKPVEAAPRWEPVAHLRGSGSAQQAVTVATGAIQWRVRWSCSSGRFEVAASPADSGESARGGCPGRGKVIFIGDGARRLSVTATGRWRAVVEQEVITPLHEPPLRAMSSARVISRGRFHDVERAGRGRATLYRLPSRRLALRFEGFYTTANVQLFVWLSRARDPRTTRQALRAPHRVVRVLKSTVGDQNYLLPRTVSTRDVRSVVVWCNPIRIAYTAAPLRGERGSATNSS